MAKVPIIFDLPTYKKKITYKHTNITDTCINNTTLRIADKNNDNNMTLIFIGLNKTTQVILKQLPKLKICKISKI
jgi:hypothetical protein